MINWLNPIFLVRAFFFILVDLFGWMIRLAYDLARVLADAYRKRITPTVRR